MSYENLAKAVVHRRVELGMTQIDVSHAGGPSHASLRKIESGKQGGYRPRTFRDLDHALKWPAGTARAILSGSIKNEPDVWYRTLKQSPAISAVNVTRPASRGRDVLGGLFADVDIVHALAEGCLEIDPFDGKQVQPASVDLHLGGMFRAFVPHGETHIDPAQPVDITREVFATDHRPFVLHPGEFALGHTFETVGLGPSLAARLEGRSSMGRLGLVVHSTAGFIDPGFRGQITLELANLSPLPIQLRPGLSVAQLCLIPLTSPAARPYGSAELGSKYQGQRGPMASRAHLPEWRATS